MAEPVSNRQYTEAEIRAIRRAGVASVYKGRAEPGRGIMYFATGDYWPDELEQRARIHRRLADAEELCAAALRREQAKEGQS